MHDVFISYSSRDLVQAETVRNVLEKNNIPCWMAPRDIPGGSNYTHEIPIAIRGCTVFLLILSQNAQASPWVLKELDSAVNCGKTILPFMLEDCALNDEFNFLLTGAQRYAAYQRKAEALEKLVGRIHAIIVRDHTPTPAEEPAPAPVEIPEPTPAAAVFLGEDFQCPACGSGDLEPRNTKNLRHGPLEWLTLLIPIVGGMAGGFLAMALWIIFASGDLFFLNMPIMLLGSIGIGILLNSMVLEWLRRRRVRRHVQLHAFRCCKCAKKFQLETTLD